MANGHGGGRPGAGRKPKSSVLHGLDGGAGHRAPASSLPAAAPPVPVDEFDAPNILTTEQRLIWLELAPHAFAARTLTKGTMAAFGMLCVNVLIVRQLATGALAGSADHRGMQQRVDASMSAFSIRPCGKALYEAETQTKKNPLDRFLKRANG